MALRIAQDGEDVGGRGGYRALDFDSFGHSTDLVRTPPPMWRFGLRDNGGGVRDDVAMTWWQVLRGVTAVTGLAALVHAGAASADPGLDASFLDALTRAGIVIKSESGAVKAAKAACGMMDQGRPELDVVEHVTRQNPGLDTTRAAQFTAIAASAYCPEHLRRAADSVVPNPPTG